MVTYIFKKYHQLVIGKFENNGWTIKCPEIMKIAASSSLHVMFVAVNTLPSNTSFWMKKSVLQCLLNNYNLDKWRKNYIQFVWFMKFDNIWKSKAI